MRRLMVEEPLSRAAVWSRRFAAFSLAVAAIAWVITRFRIVEAPAGLAVFGSAIVLACIAVLFAATAAVAIWKTGRRGSGLALTGALLALMLLAWPGWLAVQAIRLPVLNDVTTDIADPPQFSQSLRARDAREGHNPGNPPTATRIEQRMAYPGVQAILLELEADEAYPLVLKAIYARGWKIVDQSAPTAAKPLGTIDAVDRTSIMGFPDDVVVRIRPFEGQTKVDVRSVSRYGRNDFGVNARRIEQFAQEMQNQLDSR